MPVVDSPARTISALAMCRSRCHQAPESTRTNTSYQSHAHYTVIYHQRQKELVEPMLYRLRRITLLLLQDVLVRWLCGLVLEDTGFKTPAGGQPSRFIKTGYTLCLA